MSEQLRFFLPLDTSHPVKLRFGQDAAPVDGTELSFNITLAPPTTHFDTSSGDGASFSIALALPSFTMAMSIDNAVPRGLRSSAKAGWQEGARLWVSVEQAHQQGRKLHAERGDTWTSATPLRVETRAPWQEMSRLSREAGAAWQESTPLRIGAVGQPWQKMTPVKRQATMPFQVATPLNLNPVLQAWQERLRTARPTHTTAWDETQRLLSSLRLPFGKATPISKSSRQPWQEARKPPPGRSVVRPPDPPIVEPCYTPPPGSDVPLLFKDRWDGSTYLLFPCCQDDEGPEAAVVIPIRRVYMVINDVLLRRVDGNVFIPTFTMSLSLDVDSWTWSFSASVPMAAQATVVDDEPVEVEAKINGVPYRFLIEEVGRERSFGSMPALRLSGRGKASVLDLTEMSFGNEDDRTAQQLMSDVLTVNGVSIGWEIDWGLTDWLVPAGVFSHQGTYISALNTIAQAAGGYLQPEPVDDTLRVLHRYPVIPSGWGAVTPDFELPAAVTTREGLTWVRKPVYDRVFVSGAAQGVLGRYTRTGTAGELLAPTITDNLITHADAVRQRGRVAIAESGNSVLLNLRLPVLPETGIIPPGKFVRYVDEGVTKIGLSRGVNVDVGMPEVWQTITVETR